MHIPLIYDFTNIADLVKMADENKSLREEVIDKMGALITAAFGLVAALAWNGFILALFQQIFGTTSGIAPNLAYAVVVTIIAVIMTIMIARAAKKAMKTN